MDVKPGSKKVVLVGGGGHLNPLVIAALQSQRFVVSLLVRATSEVKTPPGTTIFRTDFSHASLLSAFTGQDVVVNTITMPVFEDQKRIIDAAIEAGVKHFLPGEFGIESWKPEVVEIVPYLKAKPKIVAYLRSLEDKITWTAIITGPFFDWGLRNGFFSFHVPSRTAYIHNPGYHSHRFSCSTMSTVAEAVARSLLPENAQSVANRYVCVRSFTVSQDEIMQSLGDATKALDEIQGREPKAWDIVPVNLEEKVAESYQKLTQGDTSGLGYLLGKAIYQTGGDYDAQGQVMNEKLGMEEPEDLHAAVRRVVAEF